MQRMLCVVLIASALSGCDQVRKPFESTPVPKPTAKNATLVKVNDFERSLFAEGVWRADNLTEKTEAAFNSVTRLECYKSGGREIVGTDAYCLEATAQVSAGNLPAIIVEYFPVVSWDKDRVIASGSPTAPTPICVWTQITINLHDHSIMATDTRKLGKGHEGFRNVCEEVPLAQTYHLVDQVEEFTRRRLRKAPG